MNGKATLVYLGVIIAILLLLTAVAHAQTAQVVELKPEDAAKIKALYAQQEEVTKQINEFRAKVQREYILKDCGRYRLVPRGAGEESTACGPLWTGGFEYSTDFRFIVPPIPTSTTISGCTFQSGPYHYSAPAIAYPCCDASGTINSPTQNFLKY